MPSICGYYAYVPNKSLINVLADNLRAVMKVRDLTQNKVAEAAKRGGKTIDQRTVGRVLNAEFPATVTTLEAVAKGAGIEPWQLLRPDLDVTELPRPQMAGHPRLSGGEREQVEKVTSLLHELSPAQRDLFVRDGLVKELLAAQPYPVERMRGNWTGPHAAQPRAGYGKRPKK